jgi:hypothetical protein
MKLGIGLIWLISVMLCSICLAVQAQPATSNENASSPTRFFPVGVFGTVQQGGDIKAKWYANALTILREPSLLGEAQTQRGEKTQVYRFLWLRTFHRPISVRLTINIENDGFVTVRSTDGRGGYKLGNLILDETQKIGKADVQNVLDRLHDMGFWSMQTEDDRTSDEPDQGEPRLRVVGVDGAQWVLEGVADGEYHVVDRWSPLDPTIRVAANKKFAGLCRYLLRLAAVEVEEKEIY